MLYSQIQRVVAFAKFYKTSPNKLHRFFLQKHTRCKIELYVMAIFSKEHYSIHAMSSTCVPFHCFVTQFFGLVGLGWDRGLSASRQNCTGASPGASDECKTTPAAALYLPQYPGFLYLCGIAFFFLANLPICVASTMPTWTIDA